MNIQCMHAFNGTRYEAVRATAIVVGDYTSSVILTTYGSATHCMFYEKEQSYWSDIYLFTATDQLNWNQIITMQLSIS